MRKCLNCFCVWAFVVSSRQPQKFERQALTPPSLCEGRFAGPLQYRVWKSLKGSIYPGLGMILKKYIFKKNAFSPYYYYYT